MVPTVLRLPALPQTPRAAPCRLHQPGSFMVPGMRSPAFRSGATYLGFHCHWIGSDPRAGSSGTFAGRRCAMEARAKPKRTAERRLAQRMQPGWREAQRP